MTESDAGRWTRAEDYLGAMARKRSFRRSRRAGSRTEPESPRLLLSTLPFLALLASLAVITVGVIIAAVPGSQPALKAPQVAAMEVGVAPKGWFDEAEKQFHR